MPILNRIAEFHPELTAWRQDFHAHPEIAFEEVRTSGIVAEKLRAFGCDEVHTGIAGTGVVGVIRGQGGGDQGGSGRAIGLRADMDALPIEEATGLPYASTIPGKMHACGHDGHTTMLLGAARYLAETRRFDGIVHFIFQPGEEGCGGALAMLEDGLFERFPCDAIYGMHNRPGMPVGEFAIRSGPTAAGGAFFDITVTGRGAHGARPEASIDPVLTACHVATALQSIVSRNLNPRDPAVVSITKVQGGEAYNVIPETATISGTARFFSREVAAQIEAAMGRMAEGVAAGFGATATLDWRLIFAPTVNDAEQTEALAAAAASLVGEAKVARDKPPGMGSEDFSFMMERVPGAYIQLGNGDGASLHNPRYAFNDEAIPYGAALYAAAVERGLPRE